MDFLVFFIFFFYFRIFEKISICFGILWIPYKVTKVSTKSYQGYYWKPKISPNSIIRSFFARKNPWPYLLVSIIFQ